MRAFRRALRTLVPAVALATGVAAGAVIPPTASAQPAPDPGYPAFYETSGLVAGAPGDVLRTEETPMAAADEAIGVPPHATRVMYSTTDVHGAPVPVSGVLVEPTARWDGPGPRPTLVIGRGTNGQGDHCAPSRNWPFGGEPDPLTTGRTVAAEALVANAFASRGIRVFTTDYIGLGTPGVHGYMIRDEQAAAMLDGARAALSLGPDGGPVAFWGHSQGGGASAAAVEAAPTYAPELDVVGAYASAPPAELDSVQRFIDGSGLTGAIGFSINALRDRYPAIERLLEENLNDEGRRALDAISGMCTDDIRDAYGYVSTGEWTNSGETLDEVIRNYPEALRLMEQQRIGTKRPDAPVLVVVGEHDTIVEPGQVHRLAVDWCARGAHVTLRRDVMPPIGDLNHTAQAVSGGSWGVGFLFDRFHGVPAGSTCGAPTTP